MLRRESRSVAWSMQAAAEATGQTTVNPSAVNPADVRAGVRVETITVVWMVVEALIAIGAGIAAHSVILSAFGLDSVVELVSGGALLWRLRLEASGTETAQVQRGERRASWITAVALALLCLYIAASAPATLVLRSTPSPSLVGIGLAAAALVVMPLLAWRKRSLAARINSGALRADAACSMTCAYLAAVLLSGLGARSLFGWWWADSGAALLFLIWLVPETREAFENAGAGRAACSCGAD